MKKILLLTGFILISSAVFSQKKEYVFKPKTPKYHKTEILDGKKICLKIKDKRVIAPESKVECSFEDISDAIRKALEMTYYKAEFLQCDSISENPSISIDVKSYNALFYSGMWHAQTKYIVTIKEGEKEKEEEIEQINRFFNVMGMSTVKKTLNKCFNNANLRLMELINDNLD
jgi:hypothetical protein